MCTETERVRLMGALECVFGIEMYGTEQTFLQRALLYHGAKLRVHFIGLDFFFELCTMATVPNIRTIHCVCGPLYDRFVSI